MFGHLDPQSPGRSYLLILVGSVLWPPISIVERITKDFRLGVHPKGPPVRIVVVGPMQTPHGSAFLLRAPSKKDPPLCRNSRI